MAAVAISRHNNTKYGGDYGKSPNKRRAEAIAKAKAEAKEISELMKKYDTNNTGKLEKGQLAVLMRDLNNGSDPSNEEVNWVMFKADTSKGARNFGVDSDELMCAIRTWKGYLDNKDYLDKTFEKYDTNKSGSLEREQLKALMTDLVEGDNPAPNDKEVSKVLYEADRKDGSMDGSINKTELMYAISLWYNMIEEKRKKRSSMCCVI